ncbi:MAG: hypothetical protein DYG87_09225 [Anaerolineae bacterium CFX3]|nr:hypothetical protein [Anaerolineae bacterium CFX3]MCQ3947169.1 hypothetical protein [Anaerolineae bacterium]RIK27815.1 MAG: hypothetical protein DCC54_01885 [Anaerolineae bacterium]
MEFYAALLYNILVNQRRFSTPKFRRISTRAAPLLLLPTLLLAACSALDRKPPGAATPVPPTATPLPSPTPVWFPPTDTPTPSAATLPTATPDWSPGLGKVLYTDDFTDPANWSNGKDYLINGRLTLAAEPDVYRMSLHQDLLVENFYAEIAASLNLCRGAGEYGFLVRAAPTAYYRFGLNCNGEIKADRVVNGTRAPLKLPVFSSDAPRGVPARVRIAVWAVGRELRFFLNDHYQFSVDDPVLPNGSLGVYVRAAADSPVTVSFSDLVVRQVNANP